MFPYFRSVGTKDMAMAELRELCKENKGVLTRDYYHGSTPYALIEAELQLKHRKRSSSRRLFVKLNVSDAKTNADVAMHNLLSLINEDGELTLESKNPEEVISKLDQAISQGKTIMQSNLADAVPNMDSFVNAVGNIVQVRQRIAFMIRRSSLLGSSTLKRRMAAYLRCIQGISIDRTLLTMPKSILGGIGSKQARRTSEWTSPKRGICIQLRPGCELLE